jgi:hypothetical protein
LANPQAIVPGNSEWLLADRQNGPNGMMANPKALKETDYF